LFGKSKAKKEDTEKEIDVPIVEDEETPKQNDEVKEELKKEVNVETSEETEELPITEYHETLYSSEHTSKNGKETWKRRSWESTSTIEKNVDAIDKKKIVYKQTSAGSDGIEKRVDRLFSSKGIKTAKKKKDKATVAPEGYISKVNKKTGLTYYKKK
jgi:hypothetical protein